jgi:hypothetical protein
MSTKISPESGGDLPADLHEAIRQRAEEIYERNGKVPGRDIENWIQAEREIRREAAQRVARRTAVVVKIDGIDYVGEYALAEADGYKPGEFSAGDAVAVRFEEGKMYVKRPNGKELETRVVKTYS